MTSHSKDIDAAALWLATTRDDQKPHPLLPYLRKTYGLNLAEAVDAIREAQLIRARAS